MNKVIYCKQKKKRTTPNQVSHPETILRITSTTGSQPAPGQLALRPAVARTYSWKIYLPYPDKTELSYGQDAAATGKIFFQPSHFTVCAIRSVICGLC